MRKVRILHILSMNTMSGAERVVYNLISSLSDSFTFGIICKTGQLTSVYKKICSDVMEVLNVNTISKILKYRAYIKKYKPDIIHAHDNRASILALLSICCMYPKPRLISHIHSQYPYLIGMNLNKIIDRLTRPRYYSNIFCGEKAKEYYKKHTKYYNKIKNIYILNNATDIQMNVSRSLEESIEFQNSVSNIGYIGRLEEVKGLAELFKALSNKSKTSNFNLTIIGSGADREKLGKIAAEDLSNYRIHFAGFQSNPFVWMKNFDFIIVPSKYEGLAVVILESMSLGTPVLAMDVGDISEVIEDGYNGWLIDKGNYDAFANRMFELTETRGLIKVAGNEAVKTIRSKYDINIMKEKTKLMYEGILKDLA